MLRNREHPSERRRRRSEATDASPNLRFYERCKGYDEASWRQPTRRFETRESASIWRKRLVSHLAGTAITGDIAERLADCSKGNQCHSGACQSCLRLLRRWLILEGEALATSNKTSKAELAFFTLIPPFSRVPENDLGQLDLDGFKDRIAHVLERYGPSEHWMFGGIDLSLNVTDAEDSHRYWQPHLHAVVFCPGGRQSFRRRIKRIPNDDASIAKVATVKAVKDLRNVIGYCLKGVFQHRVPYLSELGQPKFRKLIIKPREMTELAAYLNALPIQNRLFLNGVRRRGSRLITSRAPDPELSA